MAKDVKRKSSYTTGEIAKLLGININTVIKWFDEGQLKGFRLPGSKERRVPYETLKDFMRTHDLPLDLLPAPGEPIKGYRRSSPRKVVSLRAELLLKGKNETVMVPVGVTNLSKQGARIELTNGRPLTIPVPPVETILKFTSEPLVGVEAKSHLIHISLAQRLALGMKFVEIDEESARRLEAFLESI